MPDAAPSSTRSRSGCARSAASSWRSAAGADSAFLAWVAHDTLGRRRASP